MDIIQYLAYPTINFVKFIVVNMETTYKSINKEVTK